MTRHIYFRTIALAFVWLMTIANSWAAGPAYYGSSVQDTDASIGTRVQNPNNAVGKDPTTYATLNLPVLAIGASASIQLNMSAIVPKNYRAGFVVSADGVLSLANALTITTYMNGTVQETVSGARLVGALLSNSDPQRVEFITEKQFNRIRIEARSLVGVGYDLRVYYAYGVDANIQETVRGVISRFPTPVLNTHYSTQVVNNGITVCANTSVDNPDRAADTDLTNFATFRSLLDVSCPNTLRVKLESAVPRGFYAGFLVEQQGLADVQVLAGLQIRTFLNGELRETVQGNGLVQVQVLPGNKYRIAFAASRGFDEVQLTRGSLLGVLDNLKVYYGFGIEGSAFRDQQPILSDFPDGVGQTQAFRNGVLLLTLPDTSNVINPDRAANADLTNFAVIRAGQIGVINRVGLRVNLNGQGKAGNAAGAVIRQRTGLLRAGVLETVTLRTYDASGNLLETAGGTALLAQVPLAADLTEVYFNTTQDFSKVEVEIASAADVLSRTLIYYVYAEDKPRSEEASIVAPGPLPVELVTFSAQAVGPAVQLAWRTASERNNQHFDIERAQTPSAGFVAVGRVAGGGTSNGRSYTFRDETAAATQATTLYYRLRQVDADGTSEYSPVVAVSWKATPQTEVALYPNPAMQSSTVRVSLAGGNEAAATTLTIYDMRGAVLRQVPADQLTLQGQNLPAGIYHVVVAGPQGQIMGSQRLVVTGN